MAKDGRLTLSVDSGSNHMGLSLWDGIEFLRSGTVHAGKPTDPYSKRMKDIRAGFNAWLAEDGPITTVVSENIRLQLITIPLGIVFLHASTVAPFKTCHAISPSSWKKWAQLHGATGKFKDIKGLKALSEVGWPHPCHSDDEADSILIALCYFSFQD